MARKLAEVTWALGPGPPVPWKTLTHHVLLPRAEQILGTPALTQPGGAEIHQPPDLLFQSRCMSWVSTCWMWLGMASRLGEAKKWKFLHIRPQSTVFPFEIWSPGFQDLKQSSFLITFGYDIKTLYLDLAKKRRVLDKTMGPKPWLFGGQGLWSEEQSLESGLPSLCLSDGNHIG